MRSFTAILSLVLAVPALAAPAQLQGVQTYNGQKTGKYIVKLKAGASNQFGIQQVVESWENFNSFAAVLSQDELNQLRASQDVEYIAEDGIMSITDDPSVNSQTNAPWGLQRITQAGKLTNQNDSQLAFSYSWNDAAAGSGVDVYVVDTGIYTDHVEFGGRARWGATFGGYANADGHGHGTHCSGTIGSRAYGISKKVSLIAVKVLSDQGSGTVSDIVSGLNYVLTSAHASGRPSIVSMSLGGGASQPLDDAVASLTAGGVHVVVAAGNSNDDAQYYSPARAPSAVTVGATDITDARAYFSNYGALVDVFAPGVNVISTWIGSTTATNSISGTSMATPHVAGSLAYRISIEGNDTPAAWSTKIQTASTKAAITAIPDGTVNDFLRI
ncbi:peptidase 1 [Pluteus cervinus]|uniref:Peptidase 1 n=1 Tax=Pluteus cervinus TaxID=181527 RepID=A0ACD3BHR9_9AGAR|nr:peptidase 1 [Pluteus cervinus]